MARRWESAIAIRAHGAPDVSLCTSKDKHKLSRGSVVKIVLDHPRRVLVCGSHVRTTQCIRKQCQRITRQIYSARHSFSVMWTLSCCRGKRCHISGEGPQTSETNITGKRGLNISTAMRRWGDHGAPRDRALSSEMQPRMDATSLAAVTGRWPVTTMHTSE